MSFVSGVITIGYDFENKKVILTQPREVSLNPIETRAIEIILNFFPPSEVSKIHLEKLSDNYTSAFYGENNDFLRFKFTDRTKWLSIRLSAKDMKENLSNPLFSAQSNKKQLHWKAKISDLSELDNFKTFILNACDI